MRHEVLQGDCLEIMAGMEPESVDAVVTDPPAGISFMGAAWDSDKGGRDQWIAWMASIARECLRVLKPGGHALVWALPRTSHWTATAWENAGFVPRDRLAQIFGTGFPKSLDVSKAIDKAAGAEREIVGSKLGQPGYREGETGERGNDYGNGLSNGSAKCQITTPATDAARQWEGWGTALKPAMEDWWLLRKPLSEKTVAKNVIEHGTGGINIDGCRVGSESTLRPTGDHSFGKDSGWNRHNLKSIQGGSQSGRWPANLIHDGSDEVLAIFPEARSAGLYPSESMGTGNGATYFGIKKQGQLHGDSGSAARFFYTAKVSTSERTCKGHVENKHPTVKPLALMRYLVRLVTPPGGLVLDPFAGSGTTIVATVEEGFSGIGIELNPEYCEIARRRIDEAAKQGRLF